MITGTRPSIGLIPNKNQFAAVVRVFGNNKKDRPRFGSSALDTNHMIIQSSSREVDATVPVRM
jgi:hypothetical protein